MKRFLNRDKYLPIINGLIGDKLLRHKDAWAIRMHFRVGGKNISLSDLEGNRTGKKTIVFVHGLMADETLFSRFSFLEKEFTVLYVRYNTGLHISENGKDLAALLNLLIKTIPVKNLSLIGHSMGGLVVRSACYYAKKNHHAWVTVLQNVFLIAVPNAGAAMEKVGHVTANVLNRIARWHLGKIGNILEQRSNGIKDLRLGSMVEEDWKNLSPAMNRQAVPPLPGVAYHILVGTLSKDEKSLLAKYFGDGLVTPGSAIGTTFLAVSTVKIFPKTGHNAILKNPEVHQYILGVLSSS